MSSACISINAYEFETLKEENFLMLIDMYGDDKMLFS